MFYPEFEGWVRGSRRFKAFATAYQNKIRAKIKGAGNDERLKDLQAELETAFLLLQEEKFTLEYEKNAASKQRNPDYTVTFKTHTPFNVEVRRVVQTDAVKLMFFLCDKVRQLPPSMVNVLWFKSDIGISEADLTRAAVTLRQHAERKNEEFFTKRGYESASAFQKQYSHLSGVVLRHANQTRVWLNPLARHKTPPEIVKALQKI